MGILGSMCKPAAVTKDCTATTRFVAATPGLSLSAVLPMPRLLRQQVLLACSVKACAFKPQHWASPGLTVKETERVKKIQVGLIPEGTAAYILAKPGTITNVAVQPLYRLYHPAVEYYFWTTDTNEYAVRSSQG